MKMKMTLNVLGMTRWKMDSGLSATVLYVLEDSSSNDQEKLGCVAMEAKAEYEFMDKCRSFEFPALFEAECELVAGSKKKTTILVHSMKPVAGSAAAPSKP